jgi:hypothetical protein
MGGAVGDIFYGGGRNIPWGAFWRGKSLDPEKIVTVESRQRNVGKYQPSYCVD